MDYTPKIPKSDLKDGAYYVGRCRNAIVARWSALDNMFVHWRTKFGHTFIEMIHCPEDEQHFDVFVTERELDITTEEYKEIPLRKID